MIVEVVELCGSGGGKRKNELLFRVGRRGLRETQIELRQAQGTGN